MSNASRLNQPGAFPTTTWTFIQLAKDPSHPDYRLAMQRFGARYWKPVFYFLRAKGYPLQQAKDLTQGFFLKSLERPWIQDFAPQRGRFRTFLLTVLRRFVSDQLSPDRRPKQQVFESQFLPFEIHLGDEEQTYEPPSHETAEEIFMRRWRAALLENAQRRLKESCKSQGRPQQYEIFEATYFPASSEKAESQEALARRFGVTRDQVRYRLKLANQLFLEFLRAEIQDLEGSEADVDGELKAILRIQAS